MPNNTPSEADSSTDCDWCGAPVSPETAVTPDTTANDYTFCVDCPAEQAWLLEDHITQEGVKKVEENLSPVNAAQYKESPPGLRIKFFYQCLRKGHIDFSLSPRHETVSDSL